jgi:hypothetical protein
VYSWSDGGRSLRRSTLKAAGALAAYCVRACVSSGMGGMQTQGLIVLMDIAAFPAPSMSAKY